MGKKRVTQLLEQLKENQQQDLQNAAAIFTVAQVAVQQLQQQIDETAQPSQPAIAALPAASAPAISAIAPTPITEADLRQQYGSHRACRKAATDRGIKFRKTPTWQQLAVAFSYIEACDQLIHSYVATYPNPNLRNISFKLKID